MISVSLYRAFANFGLSLTQHKGKHIQLKWKVCQELMCAYAFQTSRQSEEEVPQGAVERLPEDLLRRIFARLPQPVQDALHARLFP